MDNLGRRKGPDPSRRGEGQVFWGEGISTWSVRLSVCLACIVYVLHST